MYGNILSTLMSIGAFCQTLKLLHVGGGYHQEIWLSLWWVLLHILGSSGYDQKAGNRCHTCLHQSTAHRVTPRRSRRDCACHLHLCPLLSQAIWGFRRQSASSWLYARWLSLYLTANETKTRQPNCKEMVEVVLAQWSVTSVIWTPL